MQVEWDDTKNARNIVKHRVSFDFAGRAFSGQLVEWRDERVDYSEECWAGLAEIDDRVYFIVWTMRGPDTVRLISARRANDRENRKFEAQKANSKAKVENRSKEP